MELKNRENYIVDPLIYYLGTKTLLHKTKYVSYMLFIANFVSLATPIPTTTILKRKN